MVEGEATMIPIRPSDVKHIVEMVRQLENDVTFVYFTEETSCRHCRQEKFLLIELADLTENLHLEVHNLMSDRDAANRYGVDKVPGLVLVGKKDYGVRYYGLPSQFEFGAFMQDVLSVSKGESGLSAHTKEKLNMVNAPVHIEVFTTGACAFSGRAIRIAHQLAIECDHITADAVDVEDFPDLVQRYNVLGAPTVVVNETLQFYGALPDEEFVDQVLKGIRQ